MTSRPECTHTHDDEISLVDIAATFIRRRRFFGLVFVVFMLPGIGYALLKGDTYQFTTLLKIGEKGEGEHLESPSATIATLENRWLPEKMSIYAASHERSLPFRVIISNPEDTGLIKIHSEASGKMEDHVQDVHQYLLEKIQANHSVLLERERSRLKGRIAIIEESIPELKSQQDVGSAIADLLDKKAQLKLAAAHLEQTEVLVLARKSTKETGPGKAIIVALAVLLGLMVAFFSVFFAEFASSVREHIAQSGDE
ncbi:MAG: lipopolysaccharide biosynthesis protein [Gammaproteobacteria bacterium]|nr:lipopolysaccharide biosynthesis protein [Gammaproteobacteria bacterium]